MENTIESSSGSVAVVRVARSRECRICKSTFALSLGRGRPAVKCVACRETEKAARASKSKSVVEGSTEVVGE
jgi:hypothetical protein